MTARPPQRSSVAMALALALLTTGCNTMLPGGATGVDEDTIKRAKGPTATLPGAGARELKLVSRDGKPLNGVVVQIGGKNLVVRGGIVKVPEEAWAEAQQVGKLVIIGAGFLPLSVPLDRALAGDILLTPTTGLGKPGVVSLAGGTLTSADDQALITIPADLLTGGATRVTVGTYQPTLAVDAQAAFERDVAAFIQARNLAAGGAAAAGTAGACGAPFICTPATAGIGVAVTIDGPIKAGALDVTLDLGKMMKGWDGVGTPPAGFTEAEKADALAADRILETFANFDATNDPTWRQVMRETYGITLDGTMLTFPVKLGDVSDVDGLARVEVDGLAVLGARLEVTVISASQPGLAGSLSDGLPISPGDVPLSMLRAKLPGYEEPSRLPLRDGGMAATDNGPDAIYSLIGNNGSQLKIQDDDTPVSLSPSELLTNNGGAIISNASASVVLSPAAGLLASTQSRLISDSNAALIANNAGSLLANNAAGVISDSGAGIAGVNFGYFASNNGSALIANNSSGLISNNSGALTGEPPSLTGYPFFPFEPPGAKYQVFQLGVPLAVKGVRETATGLVEYLWAGQTRVRAIMADGTPLTEWANTRGDGAFELDLPDAVPITFFIQAELIGEFPDGKPRRAYSLAFAPGPKKTALVAVDASTTMIASSTLHILNYVPPEFARLVTFATVYEQQASSLAADMPGKQTVVAPTYTWERLREGTNAYSLKQTPPAAPTPEEQAMLDAYNAAMGIIDARNGELVSAWTGMDPFQFGQDLGSADRTINQDTAVTVSQALTLRAAYDPMYSLASQGALRTKSVLPIAPDSPTFPTF